MGFISAQIPAFVMAGIAVMLPLMLSAAPLTGTLGVNGEIVETPCAIHPDYNEQYLKINDVSIDDIIHARAGEQHFFSVYLINCSQIFSGYEGRDGRLFRITFDGPNNGPQFSLQGESRGVSLEIQDELGNLIMPGIPINPLPSLQGGKTLNYTLRLMGNQERLEAGRHFALLKYRLDYY